MGSRPPAFSTLIDCYFPNRMPLSSNSREIGTHHPCWKALKERTDCQNSESGLALPLVLLFLEIPKDRDDYVLQIPHIVRTERVLAMNTKVTVSTLVAASLLLIFQATATAQMGYGMPQQPQGYVQHHPSGLQQPMQHLASVQQANYGIHQPFVQQAVPQVRYASNYTPHLSHGIQQPLDYSGYGGQPVIPASWVGCESCGTVCGGTCGAPAIGCDDCGSAACGGGCLSGGGRGLLGGAGGGLLSSLGGGLLGGGAGGVGGLAMANGGWLDVEYLLWWAKDRYVPVLATTAASGTASNIAGRLGQATTTPLFVDDRIGEGPYSGVRVSGGTWFDQRRTLGLGGRYFVAGGEEDFSAESDANGNPILARPFFNTVTGTQDALLVAYPGISHGSINVTAENHTSGFDIYFRKLLLSGYCNRFDFIGGYHTSKVKDTVEITNTLISDDGTRIPIGGQIDTRDTFEVVNRFNGGFVGLMGQAEDGRLSWNMLAKIAFGNMNQEATISGSTTSSVPGFGSSSTGSGLLALPTNIGSFDDDVFAFVPEVNVSVAYNLSNNFSLLLGYSFIYWSEVAVAGDLIDTTINTTQLTGGLVGDPRPTPGTLVSDGFFYHGLSIGGRFRF